MLYDNIPQTFMTDAGDDRGTSVYRICKNGVLRAKVADGTLHIGLGKNLCWIDDGVYNQIKETRAESESVKIVTIPNVQAFVRFKFGPVLGPEVPKAAYRNMNRPFDFYVDPKDNTLSKTHKGHEITKTFNGGSTSWTQVDCEGTIDTQYDKQTDMITATESGAIPLQQWAHHDEERGRI